MKRNFKRTAAIVLAVMMVVSMFAATPVSAATTISAMDANPASSNINGAAVANTGFPKGSVQADGTYLSATDTEIYLINDGVLPDVNPTNYSIEVEVKVVSNAAGFIFGAKDTSHFLMWQLNTSSGKLTLRPHHWNPGAASLADVGLSSVVADADRGNWVTMKIEVKGTQVTTYINGTPVDQRNHDLATWGKIGFRHSTNDEQGAFDNIKITNDDDGSIIWTQAFAGALPPAGDYCIAKEGDAVNYAGGKTPTFYAAPNHNSTATIAFDIPEGAKSFTGTVGMCDQALDNSGNWANKNDTVWFTVDGEMQAIVGPIRTNDDDADGHPHGFHDFNIQIPEGAEELTVYVNNPDNENKDHVIFFDTVFNVGEDVPAADAAVVAMDQQIANLKNNTKYMYRPALLAVKAEFDALTAEQQAAVSGAYWLATELAKSDAALAADPTFSVNAERPSAADTHYNGWMNGLGDAAWEATRAALADEVKYQLVMNNRHITNATSGGFGSWGPGGYSMKFSYIALQNGRDNLNKQDFNTNWTTMSTPFPGMGFSLDTFMAQQWNFAYALPIGEFFEYEGNLYQMTWDGLWFHGIATPSPSANMVSISKYGWKPEERASAEDTNKNVFKFAYAKYSQDNKWDGLTLGLTYSDWATAYGDTRVQAFTGPQGAAYLITTTDMIEAAPTDVTSPTYNADMAKAYVVATGDVASNIAAYEGFFETAGEFVKEENGALVFENLIVDEDGVAEVNKLDLSIAISEGVVTEADVAEKMNITWNADVVIGETESFESINGKVKFTEYGVIYGTSADAVNTKAAGGETDQAKIIAIDEGDDIDVYTIFGFRLRNVLEGKTRAAQFYISYEIDGRAYTVYSDCIEAVASIAE